MQRLRFCWCPRNGCAAFSAASVLADEEVRSGLIASMHEELGESRRSPDRVPLQLLRARRITAEQLASAYAELAAEDSEKDIVEILLQKGHLSPEVVRDFQAMAEYRTREQSGPALLRSFLRALGLGPNELANCEPIAETAHCINEYHQLCRSSSWQESLGAIGIATEWILPTLYPLIGKAIERSGVLSREDWAYFARQAEQGQSRGDRIIKALTPYADSSDSRRRIAAGVRRALGTRQRWYDGLEQLLFGNPPD